MGESAEALERRIDELRVAVRQAVISGDRARARVLRAELRRAEQQWDEALAELAETAERADTTATDETTGLDEAAVAAPGDPVEGTAAQPAGTAARPARSARSGGSGGSGSHQPSPLLPLREQVHQALTLLGVPAAPRLVVAVHRAFHPGGEMVPARLTSLRRDEERSFRAAPHARPYYLCAALTADLLAPARGLLAVSTWPMTSRVIGPLSPRVDFLTSAIRVAEHIGRMPEPAPAARRLLWQFAANIPGAASSIDTMTPTAVARAARAELAIHADADRSHRAAAARRAREQLDEAEQLFGTRLRLVSAGGTGPGAP